MAASPNHFYEFGPFRLDPDRRLLMRGSEVVPVTPKALDILLELVRSGGRIVEKDELMKAVWADSFVEEGNLSVNVFALRKALGETPDQHRYIVTVPGRGYQFVAHVHDRIDCSEETDRAQHHGVQAPLQYVVRQRTFSRTVTEEDEPAEYADEARRRSRVTHDPAKRFGLRSNSAYLVVSILVVGVAAALLYSWISNNNKNAAVGPNVRTIAVLPFTTLGSDSTDEYLGLGMADALITRLSSIQQIVVRPTSSVLRYTDPGRDPQQVGRELEVGAILNGTIQRSGDKIRITVQLVEANGRATLWAGSFERWYTDIFKIQDSISQSVATSLTLKLSGAEKELLSKRYTESSDAYQALLKGRYHWNKRTPDALKKAMEFFEHAIELDPNFAQAHAGLADCYALLSWNSIAPPAQCLPKAKQSAMRALELDETLAEAHVSLARAHTYYDWDQTAAEREYQRAIELNPNYPTAHHWYALHLMEAGRKDEALREIKRAQELDPVSLIINTAVGWIHYFARDYDTAIEVLRKTLELDPNFFRAHVWLALAYQQKRMYDQSIVHIERAIALSGRNSLAVAALAHAYAISGKKPEARKLLGEILEQARQKYVPPYFIAAVYTGLGDKGRAFEWLRKAYQDRSTALINVEPVFDSLRDDPRFRDVVPPPAK